MRREFKAQQESLDSLVCRVILETLVLQARLDRWVPLVVPAHPHPERRALR